MTALLDQLLADIIVGRKSSIRVRHNLYNEVKAEFEIRDTLLTQSKARIRELEDIIMNWLNLFPCEHDPALFLENKDCDYCSSVQKMEEATR